MTQREKVKKLLEITEMNTQMQRMVDHMANQFRTMFEEEGQDVSEFGNEIADNIDTNFRRIKSQLSLMLILSGSSGGAHFECLTGKESSVTTSSTSEISIILLHSLARTQGEVRNDFLVYPLVLTRYASSKNPLKW